MRHSNARNRQICGTCPISPLNPKMKFRFPLLAFVTSLFLMTGITVSGQPNGLRFASYEVMQDQRTALHITPGKPVCFSESLELTFDLSFVPKQKTYFGYIFRLIGNDKHNIDLIYDNGTAAANGRFRLITGDKLSAIAFNIPDQTLFGEWNAFSVRLNTAKKTLTIHAAGKTFTQSLETTPNTCYQMFFGANQHKAFQTTDVPPMKLRDISLIRDGKLTDLWPLREDDGALARNEKGKTAAEVTNPVWIARLHQAWQPRKRLVTNGFACTAIDQKKEIFYLIGEDSLYTYSIPSQVTVSYPYQSGKLHLAKGNQAFVDTTTGQLYTYNVDQQRVSRFDFATQSWDNNFLFPIPESSTEYWHSNKFYSAVDSSLYVFGGYGHLTYKNRVHRYHFPTRAWTAVPIDTSIYTPRYLAGGGAGTQGMYILGGYGSMTGQQILNPRNWNHLLLFEPGKRQFRKVYDTDAELADLTFANSLVFSEDSFYALTFPKNRYNSALQLVKGSLTKADFHSQATPIPYSFHDTHSFADLYYCPDSKSLTTVTMTRGDDDKQTVVNLYALLMPVGEAPRETNLAENKDVSIGLIIGAGLCLLAIAALWILSRRRKRASAPASAVVPPSEGVIEKTRPVDLKSLPSAYSPGKNSISLFGDLQLYDRDGNDITQAFTPLIKELFLVILLYTIRWKRGINSDKLRELLWFDKTTESARNNRSVNLTKLKAILANLEHAQIAMAAGHWKLDFDPNGISIDYLDFLNITSAQHIGRPMIEALIGITGKGSFLANVEYEWLDSFKSEISNIAVNTYLTFAGSMAVAEDPEFVIRLANNIFYFDPVNEEAMILKCKSFALLGKHSLAKSTFESFAREYNNIYGEIFRRELTDILKSEV